MAACHPVRVTPARTVRTELTRVLDLGSEAGEDPDLRVRKRTAVASAFVLLSVVVVIGVVDALTSDAISAILAALQITVFGSALLVFQRTHRLAPFIVTMATVG